MQIEIYPRSTRQHTNRQTKNGISAKRRRDTRPNSPQRSSTASKMMNIESKAMPGRWRLGIPKICSVT
ncbi:uncharacterized protein BO96DRAFT_350452 [Aspergillus niger CBS 101883]|uniref:Contig An18c0110, genomic contig n=2 Tax=Aspergillus niger TaxID=5061 RepID=A2RAM2_ASPNC|nr:uncharacterized protein BO96DRAFT_350452 [Aspergillus niger CBS 101883]XP_059602910.1 uncharacterized protein An18g03650 [Aspergillus niger]PYH51281.1 hypothetical protein BO96DRAFT_350452 [Aspergillus niger CBS 101883]CAK43193.1 unnamed protein product [Aspergillus niger]